MNLRITRSISHRLKSARRNSSQAAAWKSATSGEESVQNIVSNSPSWEKKVQTSNAQSSDYDFIWSWVWYTSTMAMNHFCILQCEGIYGETLALTAVRRWTHRLVRECNEIVDAEIDAAINNVPFNKGSATREAVRDHIPDTLDRHIPRSCSRYHEIMCSRERVHEETYTYWQLHCRCRQRRCLGEPSLSPLKTIYGRKSPLS